MSTSNTGREILLAGAGNKTFSGGTISLGDGTSSTAGSTDGFEVVTGGVALNHFVVANQQSGTNRTVNLGNVQGTATASDLTLNGNLTINTGGTLNANVGGGSSITVAGNLTNNGTLTLSPTAGDVKVGGNWTRAAAAVFTSNGRAVWFNGTGTQTIALGSAGTETFDYLLVDKASGNLTFSNSPATSVTVASPAGGSALQIVNEGGIDLNGNTLTLSGTVAGTNILVGGGSASATRNITGTGTLAITGGDKSVANNSGKTLTFGTGVTVSLFKSFDFGASLSTINGTLLINNGGSVSTNAPTYDYNSILRYSTSTSFGRGAEWTPGATSGAGVPGKVQIINNTAFDLPNGTTGSTYKLQQTLNIDTGSSFSMGAMTQALTMQQLDNSGTMTLSTVSGGDLNCQGSFTSSGTFTHNDRTVTFSGSGGIFPVGGDITFGSVVNNATLTQWANNINIKDNWTNNANFVANSRTVTFNGANNTQTIAGSTTFRNLTINHTGSGGVTAAGSTLTVTGATTITSGTFTSATQYADVSIASAGTLSLSGPISVSGNWDNDGTFNANGFAVTFNGAATQTIGGDNLTLFPVLNISGTNVQLIRSGDVSTTLHVTSGIFDINGQDLLHTGNVTVDNGATFKDLGNAGTITMSGTMSNSGTVQINSGGTPCGDPDNISIVSDSGQRAWNGAGSFQLGDVSVASQAGTAIISVQDGTNAGSNGLNWFFVGCNSNVYAWIGGTPGFPTDWTVGTNWSPTRVPDTVTFGDVLIFDRNITGGDPTITNVPTEQNAAIRLLNNIQVTLQANTVGGTKTLTLSGGTGSDLSIPSGNILVLDDATPIHVSLTANGPNGVVGGQVVVQDGAHQLLTSGGATVTFTGTNAFTTTATYSASTHPFGDGTGSNNESIIFETGAKYTHNNGLSPFGTAANNVVKFTPGSEARFFTATGFEADGRTYANLSIGDGSTPVVINQSGSGSFEFANLALNSTGSANSSLQYSSSAGAITIRGNITSVGLGDGGTFADIILSAANGISIDNAGTITFGNLANNGRGIDFESNTTLTSGTTLNLGRIVQMGFSADKILTANGTLVPNYLASPGYIAGFLKKTFTVNGSKTFEVGATVANGYAPVDVNVTGGTLPADFTAKANGSALPAISGAQKLARYWNLNASGITANISVHYPSSAVTGTESNYKFFRYSSGTFTQFDVSSLDTTNPNDHIATLNGVSQFSDWTLAEPAAVPSLSINSPAAQAESTTPLTFTVSLSPASTQTVTVNYTITNGPATAATGGAACTTGVDYINTGGMLTFIPTDTSEVIDVPICPDSDVEPDENFTVTLSTPTNALITTASGTGTIQNDDAAPPTNPSGVGAANPSTVAQGGNTVLTVTVTPGTNPTSSNLMVSGDLSLIGGSATQQFYDDGVTGGDVTANNNVFTYTATVALATPSGAKSLPISITDAQNRFGNTSINLVVTAASPEAPNALDFDGVDDAVTSNNNLTISGSTARTIEFWARSNAANNFDYFFMHGSLSSANLFSLSIQGSHLVFLGYFNDYDTGYVIDCNWHHYAVTYDGATVKTYVDGVPTPVPSGNFALNTPASPLRIGHTANLGAENIAATIDEFRVWNVERTQAQIQGAMNGELVGNESGLVLYYRFNQGTAGGSNPTETTVNDSTAGNNPATLTNFALTGSTSNWVTSGAFSGYSEINVKGNSVSILDGDGSPDSADFTDFGSTSVSGGTVTRTFTIENLGTAVMNLGTNAVSVTGDSDFTVTDQPDTTVAAGGSTTFDVKFDPSTAAAHNATVNIADDDCNENPYDFAITGTGTAAPTLPEVSVAVSPSSVAEDGGTNLDYTFTRTGDTTNSLLVNFVISGSAAQDDDYVMTGTTVQNPNSGAVTIPAGSSSATVTVDPQTDSNYEPDETVRLEVSADAGYTVAANPNDSASGTITNDDAPPATLTVNSTADTDDGFCSPGFFLNGCTLREAINAANFSSDISTIEFDIPAGGFAHLYYADDNTGSPGTPNGTVSLANITATSSTDDTPGTGIANIDPDWPHSWWSIQPASGLPAITSPVNIDGYTQCPNATQCASANGQTGSTDDAVLRIELKGNLAGSPARGLTLNASSLIEGLAINSFSSDGIALLIGSDLSGIAGNFIGTDVSGTLALANGGAGVFINGSSDNTVGCTLAGERNIISGNTGEGVAVLSSSGNWVQGNFIGVAPNGTSLLGNAEHGVEIYSSASNNLVGVPPSLIIVVDNQVMKPLSAKALNATSGGFACRGGGASSNLTLKPKSTAKPGLKLSSDAISGANIIAGNGEDGVHISDPGDVNNLISQNSIHSNTGLGINLEDAGDPPSGVTPNDDSAFDADNGPNNLQNFPVITGAVEGSTTVSGTLTSTPSSGFNIEVFANGACDPSGYGEGQTYLVSATAIETAPGSGTYTWSATVPTITTGQIFTATATDPSYNTSEFSQCYTATAGATPPTLTVIKHVVNDNGGTAVASDFTMTVTGTNVAPSASFAGAESPGTTVTLDAGSYSVGETGPAGYAQTLSADCSGTIANGESKTCTITNDDIAPQLTVIKHVVTDNGGTAVAGDFTMTVTGTNVAPSASFAGAESPGTTVTLNAGSYSVGETGPSGYARSDSADCSGTIAIGETKTCTITNDDIAPQLTVIKHVVTDNGGTAVAGDFTMTVTNA
ncbi:MAG TPA: choice-of-anchor D domain-containing protein, partial [Pyrinomonadaceae bacterium]|nr:choice-of-anchor D domain-containing protein [Pyrinomonadaceae bacterium]